MQRWTGRTVTSAISMAEQALPSITDAADKTKAEKALDKLKKDKIKAEDDLKKVEGQTTSMAGLSEPWFKLKNPGLISIPLGFLAVIIGSLLYRDRRAEEMWEELYVRQNTGIGAAKAAAH